jgi:O-antigen/teichoic acid export membrane protein
MTDVSQADETTAANGTPQRGTPQTGRARYLSLAREVLWVGAGQGGAVVAALIGLALLTRFLDPAEFGRLALALTIGNLVSTVGFGPIAAGGARHLVSARERGELPALIAALTRILAGRYARLAVMGLIAAVTIALVMSPAMGVFAALTVLFAAGFSLATVHEVVLNAGRLRDVVALHKLLQQALNYGLAIVLLMWVQVSAPIVVLAFACGAGIAAASMYRALHRRLLSASPAGGGANADDAVVAEWETRVRTYARPWERWAFLQWLQSTSDRWLLATLRGTADAGLYAVVYQLGFTPLGLFSVLIGQTMDPVVFARAGDATATDRVRQADRLRHLGMLGFGGVAAVFVIGALLFHVQVFAWLVDPKYAGVSWLLPGMAVASGLAGLATIQTLKWLSRLRPDRIEFSRHATSVLGIVFVAIGAYLGGAPGVVAAQVAYGCVYLAWTAALR